MGEVTFFLPFVKDEITTLAIYEIGRELMLDVNDRHYQALITRTAIQPNGLEVTVTLPEVEALEVNNYIASLTQPNYLLGKPPIKTPLRDMLPKAREDGIAATFSTRAGLLALEPERYVVEGEIDTMDGYGGNNHYEIVLDDSYRGFEELLEKIGEGKRVRVTVEVLE